MAKSPTSRTLEYFRADGWVIGNVERWIPYAKNDPRSHFRSGEKADLFGIIDMIAVRPGHILGIQSTGTAFAAHVRKIMDSEMTVPWLESGAGLILIGWRKVLKKREGKLKIYRPRIMDFMLIGKEIIRHERK